MLNIKNPEAHRLAKELARRRGVSLTAAITDALREQLAREPEPDRPVATVEDVMRLVRELDLKPLGVGEDPTAFLYDDDTGLPA